MERVRVSAHFDPVYVAGPRQVYGPLVDASCVIDTDGSFGENIQRSLAVVQASHPAANVAFCTSDVLPEAGAIDRVMQQYWQGPPCDFWFPLVDCGAVEPQLGASAWKPRYRMVLGSGDTVQTLPSHLAIVDPRAIRRAFIFDLFQSGYETRNRPVAYRCNVMVRRLLWRMLKEDLTELARLHLPAVAVSSLWTGVRAATKLRRGVLTRAELEHTLRVLFISREHRRRHPERRVVLPITSELSLALDIDTEEEAREIAGRFE